MSKNVFPKRITIRQLPNLVKYAYRHKTALFIYGGAGVGKSESMLQIANTMFPDRVGNNIVDFRLSDKEPTDVVGVQIPYTDQQTGLTRSVYAVPNFWPDKDWKGIIFLDELLNASIACQQVAYQIMLDHKAGDYVFPEDVVFAGAGNREGDGGAITVLLAPLANRMTLVEVEHNLTVWIEDYAEPNNINKIMIGWLKANTGYLYTGDEHDENSGKPFCSPRSIVRAANALDDLDLGLIDREEAGIIIQGDLGEGKDTELLGFYDETKLLPSTEDIMTGVIKKHALDLYQVDLLYVLSQSCLSQLKRDIQDEHFSDTDIIERTKHFLKFMYDNYGYDHMDIVVSIAHTLLDNKGGKVTPLLLQNNKRDSRIHLRLLDQSEALKTLLKDFTARFSPLLSDI